MSATQRWKPNEYENAMNLISDNSGSREIPGMFTRLNTNHLHPGLPSLCEGNVFMVGTGHGQHLILQLGNEYSLIRDGQSFKNLREFLSAMFNSCSNYSPLTSWWNSFVTNPTGTTLCIASLNLSGRRLQNNGVETIHRENGNTVVDFTSLLVKLVRHQVETYNARTVKDWLTEVFNIEETAAGHKITMDIFSRDGRLIREALTCLEGLLGRCSSNP